MAKYRLTRKAKIDLIEIWDYTVKTWSRNQAESYYSQLIESFTFITNEPEAGKDFSEVKNGLRGLRVGKHIVFYQVENESTILIIRILHGRMDLESRLSE